MSKASRITDLERRLADAERRIADLEARPLPAPPPIVIPTNPGTPGPVWPPHYPTIIWSDNTAGQHMAPTVDGMIWN